MLYKFFVVFLALYAQQGLVMSGNNNVRALRACEWCHAHGKKCHGYGQDPCTNCELLGITCAYRERKKRDKKNEYYKDLMNVRDNCDNPNFTIGTDGKLIDNKLIPKSNHKISLNKNNYTEKADLRCNKILDVDYAKECKRQKVAEEIFKKPTPVKPQEELELYTFDSSDYWENVLNHNYKNISTSDSSFLFLKEAWKKRINQKKSTRSENNEHNQGENQKNEESSSEQFFKDLQDQYCAIYLRRLAFKQEMLSKQPNNLN